MKNKLIIVLFIIFALLIIFVKPKKSQNKSLENENITTIINNETDYLKWFKEFEKLYNNKNININYTLTIKHFEEINKFLNNEDNKIVKFNKNIYIINNDNLELDPNTRSLRYTRYDKKNNNKIEILEIKLINGIYYVQLANKKNTYKIKFNKSIKDIEISDSNNAAKIDKSIYKNNYVWSKK